MQLNQTSAESLLAQMSMDDMPVIEITPRPTMLPANWFKKYKELCHAFTASLTDSVQELAFMNLSQDEFMGLLMGQNIPSNLSFRFRTPLMLGGKMDLDNMFMCATFPYAHNIDKFIMMQSGAKTIWVPNPVKKIYVPAHTAGGGDGGNATEDRLAQMAAQLVGGRE